MIRSDEEIERRGKIIEQIYRHEYDYEFNPPKNAIPMLDALTPISRNIQALLRDPTITNLLKADMCFNMSYLITALHGNPFNDDLNELFEYLKNILTQIQLDTPNKEVEIEGILFDIETIQNKYMVRE
jgi:hypothetical protein